MNPQFEPLGTVNPLCAHLGTVNPDGVGGVTIPRRWFWGDTIPCVVCSQETLKIVYCPWILKLYAENVPLGCT